MMPAMPEPPRIKRIEEITPIAAGGVGYRLVRRELGIRAFGTNAFTADAGVHLIEDHDETGSGAGGHEELYVVLRGHAVFTIAGEELPAPAGTFVLVEPGTGRSATAAAADTAVLVIGGRPGAALPVSPFEHWYAAQPAFQAGDYDRAIEIASAGLRDWPEHGQLHYQLACFHARAGRSAQALHHLRVAVEREPRVKGWVNGDRDLDSIRGEPDWPA
jgi:tetratricopeptide (TPR) repeat protein